MALPQYPQFLSDGTMVDETTPRHWPTAEELLEREGLFETIKVARGHPLFLAAHHARLSASCRKLGLSWNLSLADVKERSERVLRANQCREGSLKVTVFPNGAECGELITCRAPAYTEQMYARGFRLKILIERARPLGPAHKSTRYLKNLRAREAVRAEGFDEALFLDERRQVLEGAVTNLFLVSGGRLFTPETNAGILPGIARGEILRRWKEGVTEQIISAEMLETAHEVFVTNALLGVMPVAAVDQRTYPTDDYVVTRRLMKEFSAWQAASIVE